MEIVRSDKLQLTKQIVRNISMEIDKGIYGFGFKLPSITVFSRQHSVSRDTVERAYRQLILEGYIRAEQARGHFVTGKKDARLTVLFIFNNINSYKKNIYYSFLETLGDHAKVDIQVHHYNPVLFREIIEKNLGKYHYYVVMPHFLKGSNPLEYLEVMQKIPTGQLLLLDKNLSGFDGHMSVYQNFRQDVFNALNSGKELLKKYKSIGFVFSEPTKHPTDILVGAQEFCTENDMGFQIIDKMDKLKLQKHTVYILATEDDLALLIKKVRKSNLVLGKDIGIISFNETVFKELLDITVITTDFEQMGRKAAELILGHKYLQVKNPFKMIKRNSL